MAEKHFIRNRAARLLLTLLLLVAGSPTFDANAQNVDRLLGVIIDQVEKAAREKERRRLENQPPAPAASPPSTGQVKSSPGNYAVGGILVGSQMSKDSLLSRFPQMTCTLSSQFAPAEWCSGRETRSEARGQFTLTTSILLTDRSVVAYVNQSFSPAFFTPSEINEDIDRYSQAVRAAPRRMNVKLPFVNGEASIAIWGDVQLEPISSRGIEQIRAKKSADEGVLVDYLGDFNRSLDNGLPVYRVASGHGYVWAGWRDQRGLGHLRAFAINTSLLNSPGQRRTPASDAVADASKSGSTQDRDQVDQLAKAIARLEAEKKVVEENARKAAEQADQLAKTVARLEAEKRLAEVTPKKEADQADRLAKDLDQLGGDKNSDAKISPPQLATSEEKEEIGKLTKVAGTAPVTECDKLAAHPDDPQKVGSGVLIEKLDGARAIQACEEALKSHPGVARFSYQLGRANAALKQQEKERQAYEIAAANGHLFAMYRLGTIYAEGERGVQDYQKAVVLHKNAADQGISASQHYLGWMYENGKGVSQDFKLAMEWYLKAAKQGHANAQFKLAYAYHTGTGVQQDHKQAISWYIKAAEQGFAAAQGNLGFMYASGLGTQQDDSRAVIWYRKAAEQGNAFSQVNLGVMYEEGRGTQQDDQLAIHWYRKAAEQGNVVAQTNLGRAYYNGRGVQKNIADAINWLSKAADKGNVSAQTVLGIIYLEGRDITPNPKLGLEWLRKAADQGDDAAKKAVAELALTIFTYDPKGSDTLFSNALNCGTSKAKDLYFQNLEKTLTPLLSLRGGPGGPAPAAIAVWMQLFPSLQVKILQDAAMKKSEPDVLTLKSPHLTLTQTRAERKDEAIKRLECSGDLTGDFGPMGVHAQSVRYVVQITDDGSLYVSTPQR